MSETRQSVPGYRKLSRADHLNQVGPKRILALDGGGIRGLVAVMFLKEIERLLRERHGGDENFRLCNYFDLIGGTSTGAILAAGLALGYSASELEKLFLDLGPQVFKAPFTRRLPVVRRYFQFVRPKFDSSALQKHLNAYIGDHALGSDALRTGLAIVVKRADTASHWIFQNHPDGKYWDADPAIGRVGNKDYPLARIVRASTAAPTYFKPEDLVILHTRTDKERVSGVFVDGGVSAHNNPALAAFMVSQMNGHGFRWPAGKDDLLIVSVGTGNWRYEIPAKELLRAASAKRGVIALRQMISDGEENVLTLMQWMSDGPNPRHVDRVIQDLKGEVLGGRELFHFLRYDVELAKDYLAPLCQKKLTDKDIDRLREMDERRVVSLLQEIGGNAARQQVRPEHFPANFDLK